MRRNASTHKLLSDSEDAVFLEEEEENSLGSKDDLGSQSDKSTIDLGTDQNHNRLEWIVFRLYLVGTLGKAEKWNKF